MAHEGGNSGKVYLVGAGPGDPGLITLRGAECLRRADVVLYDYLINPRLLTHCRPAAELVCLGQHGRSRIWPQHEINAQLIRLAGQGKTVVRLKSGDPAVFARGADEAAALVEAGIPFEIVPGITAALAAGSYAGIPITHRKVASAVALVTGHEDDDKAGSALDFAALARFPGTLVFYMGVTTVARWTSQLIAAGKSPKTPVAAIRRCSFPDQRMIQSTLADLPQAIAEARLRPPVIFVVGEVVNLAATLDWFHKRPLLGRRIVVTRPLDQAASLCEPLEELGADVVIQPAIQIGPPADWSAVDKCLEQLATYDWLVFSSTNGVRYLFDRLLSTGRDLRALGGVQLAAVGPGTAEELARYHLRADLIPEQYRAEALAESLAQSTRGKRVLLVRASRGREVLAEQLTTSGATVEQVVAYQNTDVEQADPALSEQLRAGQIDWITVTSSAIARSLVRLYGDDLKQTKLASISPITSATLREQGFEPTAEAADYTMEGVVAAIRGWENDNPDSHACAT